MKKWMTFAGLLCLVCLLTCGCGDEKGGGAETSGQTENPGEPDVAGGTEEPDTARKSKEPDTARKSKEPDTAGNPGEPKEPDAAGQEDKGEAPEGEPVLEGSVKELKENGFVVTENKSWKEEDGEVSVGPGSGDDSEFDKFSVVFDEDTVFSLRTIYDGGERYEDEKAGAEDLSEGLSVNIWGEKAGGTVKAKAVQILKVVF